MGRKEEALDIIKSVYLVNTGYPKEVRQPHRGDYALDGIDVMMSKYIFQSFPVTEIEPEKLGSNLADTRGFMAVLSLMWSQTKPLFLKPHVWNMARMSYLSFALFAVAHGFFMWYVLFS